MTTTVRQQLEVTLPRRDAADQPPSPRDVQRDALRDLVSLATECAATESRIELEVRASTEQARKEFEKANWSVNQRHASAEESTAQQHQNALAELQSQHQAQLVEAEEAHQQTRERIEREHEPAERKSKQQLEQAVWLADSVLEVAQNQIREEAKKVREAIKTHDEALEGIGSRAARLLERYRIKPPPEEDATETPAANGDPKTAMAAKLEEAEQLLSRLRGLFLPRLFVGSLPWLALFLICVIAGVVTQVVRGTAQVDPQAMAIGIGSALAGAIAVGIGLRFFAKSQVSEVYKPLRVALVQGRLASKRFGEQSARQQEANYTAAVKNRDREVHRLKQKAAPVFKAIEQRRSDAITAADAAYSTRTAEIEQDFQLALANMEQQFERSKQQFAQEKDQELRAAKQKHENDTRASQVRFDEARAALERRLADRLKQIHAPIQSAANGNGQPAQSWSDLHWENWQPPNKFPSLVRLGELRVDLKQIADQSKQGGHVKLELPAMFAVPAALAFPRGGSLLIQHDRSGREQAIRLLQTAMARLLTSLPPGRARFTIIDPVGLGQNFAGFMRLADHDEALVGTRIWTESDQIEQRLADMTEHMETVIQKYLRNEFATIDEYNAQAGELAEPYRFLVVADYPSAFQGEAYRRLASIAATGARCGVYVLVARDLRASLPPEAQLEDLEAHCVNIVQQGDAFVWKDEVFEQFPLTLDPPPPEGVLTQLLDRVGRTARESKRVEVAFDAIAPSPKEFWTGDCTDELSVPIGRMGATRLQMLRLGRGVAQHALIAGKTGSGKSTLLHALVTNLAMWYSPDQVEVYLIDFKKGVEFKTYATHDLPHARAIAVESDREFGLSVLQRLDAELARRGELFRKAGVQDLGAYRRSENPVVMPRTLLIIDEFQEFFSEDDKLAQEAGLLLDRLVRQGRAFGIHLMLGSQTIGGTSGLARSTIGQMAVRVALQTSEADSQLILGDNNSAARLLSRPGEAIYNDAGGLIEANSPFQVAWLPDEKREVYLEQVRTRAEQAHVQHDPAIVFEGNAPADVRKNGRLAAVVRQTPAAAPATAIAWLGEPVAIKEPTAIPLRRQSGANVLLVGQQEEPALAVMASTMISLAAQYPRDGARMYVMDGTPADSNLAGTFEKFVPLLGGMLQVVEWRNVADTITELAEEVARRQEAEPTGQPEIFVFIYGLQRYRLLRKSEDDYGFSLGSDEPKKANSGKQFADILRDGPGVGVHVITWADTIASLERTLDRGSMREFDNRILFQMSAADSSTLIDSPAANRLGFHRALVYSEEQGVTEKFRPYAIPSPQWLQTLQARFA